MADKKSKLTYDQVIEMLVSLGKRVEGNTYGVMDAEDDYRRDPVGAVELAKRELKTFKGENDVRH